MTTPADRLTTALSERYRLERELGQGGMATVYLAEDLKHKRKVALKVLRSELAAVIGSERFLNEIRTTASLQHPHILPLHDSGTVDGTVFYVMPLVEGESLRDRLNREKQLPVEDAVRITREVAAALDYAHRRGVIHRDIKPENILLHDGAALVADFGIALAVSSAGGSTRMTETGMSLGTPHYMSPEQAMGERDLTARSDVYALGCVLYEMLVGEPPFTGPTPQAIVAKVITEKAPLATAARDSVPRHIARAIQRALSKLPADRFASAAAMAEALSASRAGDDDALEPVHQTGTSSGSRVALALVAAAALATAAWALSRSRPDTGGITAVVRLPVTLPPTAPRVGAIRALPGGAGFIYQGGLTGRTRLFFRSLDHDSVIAIAGTDGATAFAVSPSGKQVAFTANDGLWIVAAGGGTPQTVPGGAAAALDWIDEDQVVVAATGDGGGLRVVRVRDGRSSLLTIPDSALEDRLHLAPVVINGGSHILFATRPSRLREFNHIGLVAAAGGPHRLLELRLATPLGYVGGQLIFADGDGRILTAPLDLNSGHVGPSMVAVPNAWEASLSRDGVLLHTGDATRALVVHVDASGRESAHDSLPTRGILDPDLSPSGDRLLVQAVRGGTWGVYIYDLVRRTFTGVGINGPSTIQGRWHPDGNRVATVRQRRRSDTTRSSPVGEVVREVWLEYADRSQPARKIAELPPSGIITEFTPDGHALVTSLQREIKLLALEDGAFRDLPSGPLNGSAPALSPDGRLIAYVDSDVGSNEVFVKSALEPGGRVQVSRAGGSSPQWTRDGRIMYRNDQTFMMTTVRRTPSLAVDEPQLRLEHQGEKATWPGYVNYALRPDGHSLYVVRAERDRRTVIVTLNWARNAIGAHGGSR